MHKKVSYIDRKVDFRKEKFFVKKLLSVTLIIALFLCLLPSCGKNKEFPVTINDIEITTAPTKVVSMCPSFTDIIHLLQYNSVLVGVSDRCDHEEVQTLTRCGTASSPEVDIIIALGAELVLTNEPLPYDAEKRLNNNDIIVLTLEDAINYSTLKDLYINIGSVLGGSVTGAAHGESVATSLLSTLDDIGRTAFGVLEPKNVMYMDDLEGNRIATGDTFLNYLFEICNINNVASADTEWSFSNDFIAISDPVVIFCKEGIGYDLRRSTKFANITAIKKREVYEIEELWLEKQGATLISLAEYLIECTYPDLEELTNGSTIEEEVSSADESLIESETEV